jgi:hypothetical protein
MYGHRASSRCPFFITETIRVFEYQFFENSIILQALEKAGTNSVKKPFFGEFDPGSERTLAAWIRHASRAMVRETRP